ncbi:hypothetical protein [Xanthomonas campestris]
MRPLSSKPSPTILLVIATAICIVLYWPGLDGPFLMDDEQHLALVQSWHNGAIGFWDMAAGNGNWLLHRSLAMMTLAINVVIGGETSFSLKTGNLVLHLICGWVAYATLRRMLALDKNLSKHSSLISALICSIWLLHPLNVSTVLYVVQRMTQIATIFPLLGVWLYITTRQKMLEKSITTVTAFSLLFLALPAFILLGIQGKQSAIVLVGLCLVVELGWLQQPRQWDSLLKIFYTTFVALPLIILPALLYWQWNTLQSAMLEWGMTPIERLISEPRAICQYIRMLIMPYSPAMGIYTDDFAISHSLSSPAITGPAIIGLLAVSAAAISCRKRLPAFFVGWFWFLVAHSVEASIVPIELYYEHRNYLPQLGLWLMLIDLTAAALRKLSQYGTRSNAIGWTFALGFIGVVCAQTWSRALVWQTQLGISLAAIDSHPNSARAHIAFGFAAMQSGLVGDTYNAFQRLASNSDPRISGIGKIELTILNCHLHKDSDPSLLEAAAQNSPRFINPVLPYAISNLLEIRERDGCGRITPALLANTIVSILNQATDHREASQSKWTLRYNAALAYYQAGDWQHALEQTRLAWPNSPDPTIALLHVRLLLKAGDIEGAKKAFWDLMRRADYTEIKQLPTATRGTALRAVLKEINEYATHNSVAGLDESDTSPAQ